LGNRRFWSEIVWSIVYVIMLLSFFTPALLLTMSFLMVPVLILYVKLDTKRFALFYGLCLAVVYALTAWVGPILVSISLFFLPPVIVMGNLYKKKAPAKSALTAGMVTLLAEALITLLIGYALGFDPISKFQAFMTEYVKSLPAGFMGMMQVDAEQYVNLLIQVIPLDLILFSYFYAVVNHAVARRILNRMGEELPAMKPLREWRLPRTFVVLYVLAFILDMMIPAGDRSMLSTLLMNLQPLLMLAFTLQALSFLFFIAHEQRRSKALPIIAIVVLVLLFPLLVFVYSLLGVLDAALPLRERFRKNR
jgi:uncharacterized protein YybS (DUF2232 family)